MYLNFVLLCLLKQICLQVSGIMSILFCLFCNNHFANVIGNKSTSAMNDDLKAFQANDTWTLDHYTTFHQEQVVSKLKYNQMGQHYKAYISIFQNNNFPNGER